MADIITHEDLLITLQRSANPNLRLNIEILDSKQRIIGTLNCGLQSGSMSINGESDVRRTATFTIQPTLKEKIKITYNSLLWLNKDMRISVGLYNFRTKQYKYYPLGYYVYTDTSGTYDATTDSITINCADFMKKLDGTKNGQLGGLAIQFPSYKKDEESGKVEDKFIIRNAIIRILEDLAHITNYRIDDIGDINAMPDYNESWEEYRQANESWNTIPFDQEFSSGCSILSMLTTFRDLYPNYEMFFDIDSNAFICQMKPSCYEDDIFLDNGFLQRALLSESTSVDMISVRNICEIWGQAINVNYYDHRDTCTYEDNIYTASIEGYEEGYCNRDCIGLKIPKNNQANPMININKFGAIEIYSESNNKPIDADVLKANKIYAFKIIKEHVNDQDIVKAYFLGEKIVHAINVLSNGKKSGQFIILDDDSKNSNLEENTEESDSPDSNTNENVEKKYELYSKEYFQKIYSCDHVDITIIPDSPFTVEKLGEILEVKTGSEYDTISSNDIAISTARWENWKNSRLTDSITITTALLPFLDVNKKVSYKRSDSDQIHQYIISSISHDFAGYTSTITMYRFYPLYETLLKDAGTHKVLSEYSHGALSKYTHGELTTIIGKKEDV